MTKKVLSLVIIVALLLSPTAYAKPDKKHDTKTHQLCLGVHGLYKALERVSNPRAQEAIKKALDKLVGKHCKVSKLTDEQRVAADKEALEMILLGSDTAGSVTRPLAVLPATGKYGSTIAWSSNNPTVLSHDGQTLNRPALGAGDVVVTFTATITREAKVDTKIFILNVKQEYTEIEKVAADKADIIIQFGGQNSQSHVTSPMVLPVSGYNGSTIAWSSNAPSIVSHDGTIVNRPASGSGDAAVIMTAIISFNGIVDTRNFVLTVKQLP